MDRVYTDFMPHELNTLASTYLLDEFEQRLKSQQDYREALIRVANFIPELQELTGAAHTFVRRLADVVLHQEAGRSGEPCKESSCIRADTVVFISQLLTLASICWQWFLWAMHLWTSKAIRAHKAFYTHFVDPQAAVNHTDSMYNR